MLVTKSKPLLKNKDHVVVLRRPNGHLKSCEKTDESLHAAERVGIRGQTRLRVLAIEVEEGLFECVRVEQKLKRTVLEARVVVVD